MLPAHSILWMVDYKYHLTGSSSAFRFSGSRFWFWGSAGMNIMTPSGTRWIKMIPLRVTIPFGTGFLWILCSGLSLYYDIGFNDYTDKTYGCPMIRAGLFF